MTKSEAKDMLEFTRELAAKCSPTELEGVLDNLKEWIDASSNNVSIGALQRIAIGWKGHHSPVTIPYSAEVKNDFLWLHGWAAENGEYATKLLLAGLKAERSYDTLYDLANKGQELRVNDEVISRVGNPAWSDDWVDTMITCSRYLETHADNGYDILSVFTPRHNPSVFYEVCYNLKSDSENMIPLGWLADPNWSTSDVKTILYLYGSVPSCDWGYSVLRPWMCYYIFKEVEKNVNNTNLDCNSIIDKWKNVSPILEYALTQVCSGFNNNVDEVYKCYSGLKEKYNCDGDELANSITQSFKDDEKLFKRNDYYHNNIGQWSGVKEKSVVNGEIGNTVSNILNAASMMGGD